jgi:hypothetical protein
MGYEDIKKLGDEKDEANGNEPNAGRASPGPSARLKDSTSPSFNTPHPSAKSSASTLADPSTHFSKDSLTCKRKQETASRRYRQTMLAPERHYPLLQGFRRVPAIPEWLGSWRRPTAVPLKPSSYFGVSERR